MSSILLPTIAVISVEPIETFPLTDLSTNDSEITVAPPSHAQPIIAGDVSVEVNEDSSSLGQGRIIIAIAALTGVNFLSSLSNGFITVGLPRMASDLFLPQHLLLWPSAVYPLTCGSCLLLAGSVADVIGNRRVHLTGGFLTGWFIIACGLARTGVQIILFRAMQGIAVSLCLPTSVAIIAHAVPSGRKRNIGFSCLGFVMPIGFSMGLVLEGVILDTVGWRFSYYLCGGLSLALFFVSLWALPRDLVDEGSKLNRLKKEIDWVGAGMASTCLALFSYVLATLTDGVSIAKQPVSIVLLTISVGLVPAFICWEQRRERLGIPVLIPNSLWNNTVFTSVCLTVIFANAVANGMETFCSLFFQEIQHVSALGASLRILPSLVVGFVIQLSTGLLIHRTSPYLLVLASLVLSAGSPLIMALLSVRWPFWFAAFPAQLLAPLSADIMFTIGLLVVSDVFPARTQGLAGAVFNTVVQFGTSIGLTVMAVVAASVTGSEAQQGKSADERLLKGYRAVFWTGFGWMGLACCIGAVGLKRMGRVGVKRD